MENKQSLKHLWFLICYFFPYWSIDFGKSNINVNITHKILLVVIHGYLLNWREKTSDSILISRVTFLYKNLIIFWQYLIDKCSPLFVVTIGDKSYYNFFDFI